MINKNRRDQSGHAALLFALMIPLLFGVFILGTDGARALQSKARLEEASEAAALAIAGQNTPTDDERDLLAKKYIQYYFPFADIKNIKTEDIACEDNNECDEDASAAQRFFEYKVAVNLDEANWFSKSNIQTGFGDVNRIGGNSSARKYQSKAVDVVLVADFSGSMQDSIDGEAESKERQLIDVIQEVADTLSQYNEHSELQSTIAFTGFNFFAKDSSGQLYTYLICSDSYNRSSSNSYNNWGNSHNHNSSSSTTYSKDQGWCFRDDSYNGVVYSQYVDVGETTSVDNIFSVTDLYEPLDKNAAYEFYDSGNANNFINARFYEIEPTTDFTSFNNKIDNFYALGGTASYSGLISGARLASKGQNARKLIILLSDGEDSYYTSTSSNLPYRLIVDGNLCGNILTGLNKMNITNSVSGTSEHVVAQMYAIGFGYKTSAYPLMQQCVGQGNVYDAKNSEAIKDKILELIAEEMGRLSPSD